MVLWCIKHGSQLEMSKKVKELVMEEKSQNIYILVYERPDGQKQLLCSYDMKEDIDFIISRIKNNKLELPLQDFESYKQLTILTIPHSVNFGLKLPSVEKRKTEFDNLLSDLQDEISNINNDNLETTNN